MTNKSIDFSGARSLVSKRKKARQSDETELDDLQPVIEENGDEISLRFDKPKVIDFRIEKTARELKKHQKRKEGSAKAKLLPEDDTDVSIEYIGPEESATELVIDDIKKSQAKKSAGRRRTANKTVEEPGLQEIVIKGPAKAKKQNTKYVFPPLDLLIEEDPDTGSSRSYRSQALEGAKKLEETLLSFGVSAKVVNVTRGPTVTRYELQPSAGVKVSRIVNLSDDIIPP